MKDIIQSKKFKIITQILGVILVVLIIFAVGMEVGQRRAQFSYRFNENYRSNFSGPHSVFSPMMGNRDDIFNSNGAIGTIISFQSPNIIIKGPGEIEKTAILNDKTTIRQMTGTATTSDLVVGESVVIIGTPNENGTINASLIRIMPPMPPERNFGASTSPLMK